MQANGFEWSVGYLWRETDALERLVLIALALMLIRVVAIVTDFWYRLRSVPAKATNFDNGTRRRMAAELSLKLGALRSIFFTAPYLGLAGSCSGILSTFRAYEGSRAGFIVMVASGVEAALLSTAAGILAAVAATFSYNYLCTRINLFETTVGKGPPEKTRFPLRARFSAFPFSALMASAVAISLAAFMIFPSFRVSKGLAVRLLKIGALEGEDLGDKPIIITIDLSKANNSPTVYVNSKKTAYDELKKELQTVPQARPPRSVAYVQAARSVPWRDVINTIDATQGLHTDVVLLTTTPVVSER